MKHRPPIPSIVEQVKEKRGLNIHKQDIINSSSDSDDDLEANFEYYQQCRRDAINFGHKHEKEKIEKYKAQQQKRRRLSSQKYVTSSTPRKTKSNKELTLNGTQLVGESLSKVRKSNYANYNLSRKPHSSLEVSCPSPRPRRTQIYSKRQALENFRKKMEVPYTKQDQIQVLRIADSLMRLENQRIACLQGQENPEWMKETRNVDAIGKINFVPTRVMSNTLTVKELTGF